MGSLGAERIHLQVRYTELSALGFCDKVGYRFHDMVVLTKSVRSTKKSGRGLMLQHPLLRGFLGRCPKCGEGRLFRSYLKVVEECKSCGEKYGHFRADDAPP